MDKVAILVLLFGLVNSLPQLNLGQLHFGQVNEQSLRLPPQQYGLPQEQEPVPEPSGLYGTPADDVSIQEPSGLYGTPAEDESLQEPSGLYGTPADDVSIQEPSGLYGTPAEDESLQEPSDLYGTPAEDESFQEPSGLYGTPAEDESFQEPSGLYGTPAFDPREKQVPDLLEPPTSMKFSEGDEAEDGSNGIQDIFKPLEPEAGLPRLYESPEESQNIPVKTNVDEDDDLTRFTSNSNTMMLMPFNFDWQVRDTESDNRFSHTASSDGRVTEGEYSVLLPDGRLQIVSYSDDGTGYKVKIRYE